MVEDNEQLGDVPEEEQGEETVAPDPEYGDLVQEEPERPVDMSGITVPKSISEEEEETISKTDLQAAMHSLLPKFKDSRINELMKTAMVSRIWPDNYMDKHFLIAASLIEEKAEDDDLDVVGTISQVQDGLSIGYEGRCRIELGEIAGVAHEAELEQLSKDLGL